MPLDAITISALTLELKRLEGGRVDKIQQPARDMLLLSVRAGGENLRLLLSVGTGSARAHLTETAFENPPEPPMFCMLLRKHLTGARILSVTQPEGERMLLFTLETRDELGVGSRRTLAAELIGRSANVILVGEDGRILDCMRRVDYAGDALRRLLPGMLYRLPPRQEKPAFFALSGQERRALVEQAQRDRPMDKWLLDSFSGLSPLICRELAARCGGDWELLPAQLDAFAETVQAGELRPWLLLKDGAPMDYSFMPILQYGQEVVCREEESFSRLLDEFYSARDRQEQRRRRGRELLRSVRTARDRLERKLAAQRQELERTKEMEAVRRRAELVTANLYRLKKGARELRCADYYEPDCPETLIPLDPLKTPQQNAAALFKEYNKLKGAKRSLGALIGQNEEQLEYLNSVLEELDRAETERDLSDIRSELAASGLLRQKKAGKPEKTRPQAPLRFLSDDGLEILVGRSNTQNDELTTKLARRTDYWLHTQKTHGSHVIIRCDGLEPPERTVEQAACLAAYYSQARESGKTAVDCTMVRFVRKPSGALPGKVVYTGQRTLLVQADPALAERLKR